MKVILNVSKDGRNLLGLLEEVVGYCLYLIYSIEDGLVVLLKFLYVNSFWSVGLVCFIVDGDRFCLYILM